MGPPPPGGGPLFFPTCVDKFRMRWTLPSSLSGASVSCNLRDPQVGRIRGTFEGGCVTTLCALARSEGFTLSQASGMYAGNGVRDGIPGQGTEVHRLRL